MMEVCGHSQFLSVWLNYTVFVRSLISFNGLFGQAELKQKGLQYTLNKGDAKARFIIPI